MSVSGPNAVYDLGASDVIFEGPILFASFRVVSSDNVARVVDITGAARKYQQEQGNFLKADFSGLDLPPSESRKSLQLQLYFTNMPHLLCSPDQEIKLTGKVIAASYARAGSSYKDVVELIRAQQAIGKRELPSPRHLFASEPSHENLVLKILYS